MIERRKQTELYSRICGWSLLNHVSRIEWHALLKQVSSTDNILFTSTNIIQIKWFNTNKCNKRSPLDLGIRNIDLKLIFLFRSFGLLLLPYFKIVTHLEGDRRSSGRAERHAAKGLSWNWTPAAVVRSHDTWHMLFKVSYSGITNNQF